jgi:formylglycine-generating enzyme required for sulfatase activity
MGSDQQQPEKRFTHFVRVDGFWIDRHEVTNAQFENPAGPELISLRMAPGQTPSRVIKGGSYLCSMNYCSRFRPAARQPQESDLAAGHLGFRTVLNRPNP